MDVLPAQASAVPCERVFSSSKETDTLRRTSMSPLMMEVLQILKYIYRHDRLAYFGDLVCTEEELSVVDIPPETIEYLIAHGKITELMDMLREAPLAS
ncbi:hypothetical protein BDZ89DRAFT_536865 [Hymenopellis radicata]|nr:hypothetical protein BDZ89DRAFT_536865 [Hymenopellis radicata]